MGNWEKGRRTPRGEPLGRLLDALDAPARLRSRLLALADPAFARVELDLDLLGTPPHSGAILRALRLRSGIGQTELACRLGVAQSTVAWWESGDDAPDRHALQDALFAVGASVEEAALAIVATPGGSPSDLLERSRHSGLAPHALQEAQSLDLERDLWWTATLDPSVDILLARSMTYRVQWYVMEERYREAAPLVRRATRLTHAAGQRGEATAAVMSFAQARLDRGEDPRAVARDAAAWAEGLTEPMNRAWSLATQARAGGGAR